MYFKKKLRQTLPLSVNNQMCFKNCKSGNFKIRCKQSSFDGMNVIGDKMLLKYWQLELHCEFEII